MKKFVCAVALMALFLALPAAAQDKKVGENLTYTKTTVYSFEASDIESDCSRSAWDYAETRRGVKHSNLIKVREEFKDKVMQSVSDL